MHRLTTGALALTAAFALAGTAQAAEGCAVSQVNGKASAGIGVVDTTGTDTIYDVALTGAAPLGCRFAGQIDLQGVSANSNEQYGASGHLFARDPSRYLIGITGGYVDASGTPASNFVAAEAEYYFDRWTFSAVAGASDSKLLGNDTVLNVGVSYYATDNLRFSVSNLRAFSQDLSGVGAEWRPAGGAISWFADAQSDLKDSKFSLYKIGARVYFGAAGKSLKAANREDDPSSLLYSYGAWYNLSLSQVGVLTSGGGLPSVVNGTCPPGFYYVPSLSLTQCFL
ncbi:hypothetical protein BH11PSE2_BH11PSE2_22430 [soil metagenome]